MTNIIPIRPDIEIGTLDTTPKQDEIDVKSAISDILHTAKPQSKGNNLATKLTLQNINEHFHELHLWNMEIGNTRINPAEIFENIDIAMLIIQKLEQYKEKIYTESQLKNRKDMLIRQAFSLIAEKLGIKTQDEKEQKEKVTKLYNRYRSSIQKEAPSQTPDSIKAERKKEYTEGKDS